MIRVYTQAAQGQAWLRRYWGHRPRLACVLGFTETGLIPGISAAGATPRDRQTTAIADAEFLYWGQSRPPTYPLPPLQAGASPVIISRAIMAAQHIPLRLVNAGLPMPVPVPHLDLGGQPAQCLHTGQALPIALVRRLFHQGMVWGQRFAQEASPSYLMVGECVVGGTTTALAAMLGLGFAAEGKVNSSHPACNHAQKNAIVAQGLDAWRSRASAEDLEDPLALIAAVGDPMQAVAAGITLAGSRHSGIMLAGGTQMLAVYALARAIAARYQLLWQPDRVVVSTTRWVAEDPTGDTVGLAEHIGDVPLMASQLSFAASQYPQLRCYEDGFVKEGVAAGGCAIAAHLYLNWHQPQLLHCIERLFATLNLAQSANP